MRFIPEDDCAARKPSDTVADSFALRRREGGEQDMTSMRETTPKTFHGSGLRVAAFGNGLTAAAHVLLAP
jgi:hypothetical protein